MTNSFFETQLAPSALGMTVQNFVRAFVEEPPSLVLRPPFQRNLVWNPGQKSYLIDSILRGFPVPEVYIQKRTDPDGVEEIVVVDGQQRISTCIDFVGGDFTLDQSEELDPRWRGKAFSDLEPDLRSRFRSFEFVARQLPDVGDEALRQVFRRLNRTVESLQPQELRHAAYTGEFIRLVEAASESKGLSELSIFSLRDSQRRKHDEFVSEVFYARSLEAFPNKKDGMDELYMTYERQGMPTSQRDALARSFGRANAFLSEQGGALKKTRFRNKSDAYTLLYYLMARATQIPRNSPEQGQVVEALAGFGDLVNLIKRTEGAGDSTDGLIATPAGQLANSYLRAVERAASDRSSRVSRYAAVAALLDPLFESVAELPLGTRDELWLAAPDEAEEADEPDEVEQELQEAERVLLED